MSKGMSNANQVLCHTTSFILLENDILTEIPYIKHHKNDVVMTFWKIKVILLGVLSEFERPIFYRIILLFFSDFDSSRYNTNPFFSRLFFQGVRLGVWPLFYTAMSSEIYFQEVLK